MTELIYLSPFNAETRAATAQLRATGLSVESDLESSDGPSLSGSTLRISGERLDQGKVEAIVRRAAPHAEEVS